MDILSFLIPEGSSRRPYHAKIRRDNVFLDAFNQLHGLGGNLKNPVQITFVNRFGGPEAGIDGGGVTKEFLTSITQETFSMEGPYQMFIENDQHLLYPNPTIIEEIKEASRLKLVPPPNAEWVLHGSLDATKSVVTSTLEKYEFLGRIIGKCLYEGILVDVSFASFFLLKWALTGGDGSASKESGYRANLNDLRDLDEGLYQGLVSKIFLSTPCFACPQNKTKHKKKLTFFDITAQAQKLPQRRIRLWPGLHHQRHLFDPRP
jgi:ubiquitin-protein ligase E3 C